MRIFTVIAIIVFCILVSAEVLKVAVNQEMKPLCKTWYFIPPNLLNLVVTIVFLFQAKRVSSFFNTIKDRQMAMLKYDDTITRSTTLVKIEKRSQTICQLYFVVCTIACVNLYGVLYSGVLFYLNPDDNDCTLTNNSLIYALTTCTSRYIADIVWVYPIMQYFWPGSKACCFCGKINED